jgi:hypothetical protein
MLPLVRTSRTDSMLHDEYPCVKSRQIMPQMGGFLTLLPGFATHSA